MELHERKSLFLFPHGNTLRIAMFKLMRHGIFKKAVMTAILLNAIVLGMMDFSNVAPATGEPKTEGSWRNTVVEVLEIPGPEALAGSRPGKQHLPVVRNLDVHP